MAINNEFITRFLVEYAIKNESKMLAQDQILAKFGKETARVGASIQNTSRMMKTFGAPAQQHKRIITNLAKNYKNLGFDIKNSAKAEGQWFKVSAKKGQLSKKSATYTEAYMASMVNLQKKFTPVIKSSKGWAMAEENLITKFKAHGKNAVDAMITTKGFMSRLKESGVAVNEQGEFFDEASGKVLTMDETMSKASRYSMQQFKAAAMGIMFAGQAMAATFGGMINNVLGAVGIFDAFRGILMGILLPVLMPLIEKWLPKFLEWLEKPGNSEFLGKMILFGFVLGKFLAITGQVVLLLGSLGWSFKGIAGLSFVKWAKSNGGLLKVLGGFVLKLVGGLLLLANGIDFVKGIMEGKWMKVLLATIGIVASMAALFLTGIPAAIAAAGAAFMWLANKFGIVRSAAMLLAAPIMLAFNSLMALYEAGTKGPKAAISNWWDRTKNYATNMGENAMAGFGGPVESSLFQGKGMTQPSLIEASGADPLQAMDRPTESIFNYNPNINVSMNGDAGQVHTQKLAREVNFRLR